MFSPIQFRKVIYCFKKMILLQQKAGQGGKQATVLCALLNGIEVYMLELYYFMPKAALINTFQNPCTHWGPVTNSILKRLSK